MNKLLDFYHVDSMETVDYEPIYRLIPGAALVAPAFPEWFDEERARAYFRERNLPHQERPSDNPSAVVTTQYQRSIARREYSRALAIRLMYGLGEKGALHGKEWCEGFDLVLCPGEMSRQLISRWGVCAVAVGFPKYDAFFRGEFSAVLQRQKFGLSGGRLTVLYAPTWSVHSSIPRFAQAIKALCSKDDCQVLFKPHTVTVRRERELIERFRPEIDSGKMILVEKQIGLAELFPAADVVLADDMSGAFWESVVIANLPTVALCADRQLQRSVLETRVAEVAVICDDPGRLSFAIDHALRESGAMADQREAIADGIVANRDGSAALKAAQAINEAIENGKPRNRKPNGAFPARSAGTRLRHAAWNYLLGGLQKCRHLQREVVAATLTPRRSLLSQFQSALSWIEVNSPPGQGIRVHAGSGLCYPEVTGYYIPTLLHWGHRQRAVDYARWLLTVQNPDGSWSDPAGKFPYTFDTGQILKGLLAVLPTCPAVSPAIRRGCDWLLTQIEPDGRVVTPNKSDWGLPNDRVISENIHLYALEPLYAAGRLFSEPAYLEAAERALGYYLAMPDLTEFNTLSHFHAYVLEALIDLGHPGRAAEGMKVVERLQRPNGSVPAYAEAGWVCSTGLAQYAVIWYKLGMMEPADRAFDYLCRLQKGSGGFLGSSGRGADYFPDREISWAVKYFLDALKWKIRSEFDQSEPFFPTDIAGNDGRYRLVADSIAKCGALTVLDAGCGKGRFLKRLAADFPSVRLSGLDVSEKMLANLPDTVARIPGGLLNIPVPDRSYSLVFTVEALEHAVDLPRALDELSRVVAAGGTLVIVDKNRERLGRLKISPWEQWFDALEVANLLQQKGFDVSVVPNLPYEDRDGSDGLFIGWVARKK